MKEEQFKLWEDLKKCEAYIQAIKLGEIIWNIVDTWNNFEKFSIGNQVTRSADSIAANISEGWGRYSYRDKYNYFRIARGSLLETMTWVTKAHKRTLISASDLEEIKNIFVSLPYELNKLMKSNKK